MQEDLVSEGWLANYRTNVRRILQGKGFDNVDFLPEPFAVYQYYRYGEKHPLVAERRKHHALVIDFGGGTFDVCVITTTKEGDISQGGRMARPLSASSNSIGGFSVNRLIAEELIRKVLASRNVTAKVNKGLELYRRWRKEGMDLTSLSTECYCTFAYSALACFRMGMSGLGSF
jgi:molecular chaperone DnaK (HSP70)